MSVLGQVLVGSNVWCAVDNAGARRGVYFVELRSTARLEPYTVERVGEDYFAEPLPVRDGDAELDTIVMMMHFHADLLELPLRTEEAVRASLSNEPVWQWAEEEQKVLALAIYLREAEEKAAYLERLGGAWTLTLGPERQQRPAWSSRA